MTIRLDRLSAAGAVPRLDSSTRLSALMVVALGSSMIALAVITAKTGIRFHSEFLGIASLAVMTAVLSLYCDFRGLGWRIADLARLMTFFIASLLLCGLVSNGGLGLRMPVADPLLASLDAYLPLDSRSMVYFTASQDMAVRVLKWAYDSSAVLCLAAAAWMVASGERLRFWRFVATAVVTMQATAIASMFFPARGAILHYDMKGPGLEGLPIGAGTYAGQTFDMFYSGVGRLVRVEDLNGIVTFPSFHTVLALLIVQGAYATPARWPAIVWAALTIVSTIPMGGHYVTDLIGGFALWAVSLKLVERISAR